MDAAFGGPMRPFLWESGLLCFIASFVRGLEIRHEEIHRQTMDHTSEVNKVKGGKNTV